uniref:Small nuclear ribonucleoprotein Sm D3 n=1 Tax=Steinernema glaseri TaxID=37863 RepID=A0A1I7Z1I4_9BILA
MTAIGVPIKILHEAEGHIVTLETTVGEVYRGKLIEAEDNMNCQMCDVTVTYRDGRNHQLENVFIRGSKIRFMILPDMLKNAPMFKNIGRAQKGAVGMGLGDQTTGGGGRGGGLRGRGTAFRRGSGFRGGASRGAAMPRGASAPYRA